VSSNRSRDVPASVSTDPSDEVTTAHQSTAARSASTIGVPNRQVAAVCPSNAQAAYAAGGCGSRNGCERKMASAA
jgi:hypothetical protein